MILFIIIFLIPYTTLNFEFKYLTINPSSNVAGDVTQYEIVYDRYINNVLSSTTWDREPVPAGSLIYAFFPQQYDILSSLCKSVSITYSENSVITTREASPFMCSIYGKTIAVEGAIPIDMFIIKIVLKLGNIINPIPALLLTTFGGKIGNDYTTVGGTVQLYPAEFENCLITFQPSWLNITSTMIIILNPKNIMNTSAYILIYTPPRWTNDISNTSKFSINQIMSCQSYGQTTISNTPTCSGNSNFFTINISNLFTGLTSSSFKIVINNIVSPPTLESSDSFYIASYINVYEVDKCTVSVTGLIANRFYGLTISPANTKVNSNSTLRFGLILADYCDQYDDLQITFPSSISLIFQSWNSTSHYNQPEIDASGRVFLFTHIRGHAALYLKGDQVVLKVASIKMPPSSKPAQFTVKILRNGYQKMVGTTSIQATPSTIIGDITLSSSGINQISTYTFNLAIPDYLSSSGKIKIIFPNQISLIQPIWGIYLIGTAVQTNPVNIYANSNNSLLLSSINSSNANVPSQILTIVVKGVRNPSVAQSGSFLVTTYFSQDGEEIVSVGALAGITLCSQNCQTCSFQYDNCTTCDILSSYPYFFNFSCFSSCPINTFIYVINQTCLSSCPINYNSNGTHCIPHPEQNNTTNNTINNITDNNTNNSTNIILIQTLTSKNIYPIPFNIVGALIFIVCILSKIKYSKTLLCKSLYSFWSVLEWSSIVFGGVIYFKNSNNTIDRYFIFLIIAGCLMYLLNLFGLFFQTWYLKKIPIFLQWQQKTSNSYLYLFVVIFSTLVTHKFKNILFCQLFDVQIFSIKVRDILIFRIFSVLSIIPSGILLYASSFQLSQNTPGSSQQFMGHIDIIMMTSVCIILSFVELVEKTEKIKINNGQQLWQDLEQDRKKQRKKEKQEKQAKQEKQRIIEQELESTKKQFKKNYIDTGLYWMYI